eukprot:13992382-Alexandrium_andersonii.AAC.1
MAVAQEPEAHTQNSALTLPRRARRAHQPGNRHVTCLSTPEGAGCLRPNCSPRSSRSARSA